jgi:hypothetical protein
VVADFDWYHISAGHTNDTEGSPLISTTLNPQIANTFGWTYLTLDVCPERALLLSHSQYLGEMEVYVPFFLLPEEITHVSGFECGVTKSIANEDQKKAADAICRKESSSFQLKAHELQNQSALTKLYWQIYAHREKDKKLIQDALDSDSTPPFTVSESSLDASWERFYDIFLKSPKNSDIRKALRNEGLGEIKDCASRRKAFERFLSDAKALEIASDEISVYADDYRKESETLGCPL